MDVFQDLILLVLHLKDDNTSQHWRLFRSVFCHACLNWSIFQRYSAILASQPLLTQKARRGLPLVSEECVQVGIPWGVIFHEYMPSVVVHWMLGVSTTTCFTTAVAHDRTGSTSIRKQHVFVEVVHMSCDKRIESDWRAVHGHLTRPFLAALGLPDSFYVNDGGKSVIIQWATPSSCVRSAPSILRT